MEEAASYLRRLRRWIGPFPFLTPSPSPASPFLKNSNASSANSTPRRLFKRPFPPPSPAKHSRAALARRKGSVKPNEGKIPESGDISGGLDKRFGFSGNFASKYELGEEVGRGHFGFTCLARLKKGELKGRKAAVKVIPKAKELGLPPAPVHTVFHDWIRQTESLVSWDSSNCCTAYLHGPS